jgi:hypothetical protein
MRRRGGKGEQVKRRRKRRRGKGRTGEEEGKKN